MTQSTTSPSPTRTRPGRTQSASKRRELARLLEAGKAVLGDVEASVLQVSRRGGVLIFKEDGQRYVFKLMGCTTTWRKRVARMFGWNPARRAAQNSRLMLEAGLPVVEIVKHGHIPLPTMPRAVYTIARHTGGWHTVRQMKENLQPGKRAPIHPTVRQLFCQSLGVLRALHVAHYAHADFHSGNVLCAATPTQDCFDLYVMDIESTRKVIIANSDIPRDFCRFVRNFLDPYDPEAVVELALDAYSDGDNNLRKTIQESRYMGRMIRRAKTYHERRQRRKLQEASA